MAKSIDYSNLIQTTNKLRLGETYTYKNICEILEITYYAKGGNSKNKQLDILGKLLDIEVSNKGITVKAFKDLSEDEKLEIVSNNRGGSKSKYMEESIMSYGSKGFLSTDRCSTILENNEEWLVWASSRSEMIQEAGYRNQWFNLIGNNIDVVAERMGLHYDMARYCYNLLVRQTSSTTKDFVKKLKSSLLCTFFHTVEFEYLEDEMQTDEEGNEVVVTKLKKRLATHEEIALIDSIKHRIMKDVFKVGNLDYIMKSFEKRKLFYILVDETVKESFQVEKATIKTEVHMNKKNMLKYIQKRGYQDLTLDDISEVRDVWTKFRKVTNKNYSSERNRKNADKEKKESKLSVDKIKQEDKMRYRSDFMDTYKALLEICLKDIGWIKYNELTSPDIDAEIPKKEPYYWTRKDIDLVDKYEEERNKKRIEEYKKKQAENKANTTVYEDTMSDEKILAILDSQERDIEESSIISDMLINL